MRKRAIAILVVLLLTCAAWLAGNAQEEPKGRAKLSDFRLVLEFSPSGVKGQCLRGCAWKTVTYGCPKDRVCKVEIDQRGIGGAR